MTIEDVKAEIARGQVEAVRMLDEWCSRSGGREVLLVRNYSRTFTLWLRDPAGRGSPREFTGESPEAARANAAEAIRGEL